jgi:hypothetical protein
MDKDHMTRNQGKEKKASEQANLKAHGEGNEEEKESLPAVSFVCADGSFSDSKEASNEPAAPSSDCCWSGS